MVTSEPVISNFIRRHIDTVVDALARVDVFAVQAVVEALLATTNRGGAVFTVGNGGSGLIAEHLALGLTYNTRREGGLSIRASCLNTEAAVLTTLANDHGPELMFAHQVEARGVRGDVLVVLSASGESRNTMLAAEVARDIGLNVIALIGRHPSSLSNLCHHVVVADAPGAGAVEDVSMTLVHAIYGYLMQARKRDA